eukprot:TRINITY_DN6760_c0_g1_i2.p1 TRINITY_DN6760_c0_g1~~TRINITY_DN6760_c0_g1_i2.p1  ORF type:complete len:163 (-),score=15.41 TRINITY_DN6760_c0_g1_i2:31-519(-)
MGVGLVAHTREVEREPSRNTSARPNIWVGSKEVCALLELLKGDHLDVADGTRAEAVGEGGHDGGCVGAHLLGGTIGNKQVAEYLQVVGVGGVQGGVGHVHVAHLAPHKGAANHQNAANVQAGQEVGGHQVGGVRVLEHVEGCLLYTSPSPRDRTRSRMPSSA